jgi:hypothetical protein
MNRRKIAVMALAALGLMVVGASFVLPALARGRAFNCGGNSAALSECKSIVECLQTIALERGGETVVVTNLSASERENFRLLPGMSWLQDAKVLVTRAPVSAERNRAKQIVAVCDRAFDNVPRRSSGRPPMTHAVAYSDGSTGLISMEEFQLLDLSQFVDVRNIPDKSF